jgi:hypothetical protein
MKGLTLVGAALALLGLLAFAMPYFTTTQTKDVAKIGDLSIQSKEVTPHSIPPLVSGGLLVIGIVLMGAGMMNKQT